MFEKGQKNLSAKHHLRLIKLVVFINIKRVFFAKKSVFEVFSTVEVGIDWKIDCRKF